MEADQKRLLMMGGNAAANLHLALADEVLSSMAKKKTVKET